MMMDPYKETGIVFRKRDRNRENGESLNLAVRKALAEHRRLLQGLGGRVQRLGGRYGGELQGPRTTRLDDGTVIRTWVNPFGLRPILQASVDAPELSLPVEPEKDFAHGFIYWPANAAANYGWGEPYENPPGTPVNPPLGTALNSSAGNDASFLQYRRMTIEANGRTTVHHRQDKIGGKRWKLNRGRTISWRGVAGWQALAPANVLTDAIFYNGNVLADHDWMFVAANWKTVGQRDWIYVIVSSGDDLRVARRTVAWNDDTGSPGIGVAWEESDTFQLPGDAATAGANILDVGSCDINSSCTEATITVPLSTPVTEPGWGLKARWFQVTVVINESPAGSVHAVIAEDSDATLEQTGAWDTATGSEIPGPPCGPDNCGHCMISYDEPQSGGSSTTWDGDFKSSVNAIIDAKYKNDSDQLTRMNVALFMIGGKVGHDEIRYNWRQEGSYYYGSGASYDQQFVERNGTKLVVDVDGTEIFSVDIFLDNADADEQWSHSWGNNGLSCQESPGASGSLLYENVWQERQVRIHPRLSHAEYGFFAQVLQTFDQVHDAYAANAYCGDGGSQTWCSKEYADHSGRFEQDDEHYVDTYIKTVTGTNEYHHNVHMKPVNSRLHIKKFWNCETNGAVNWDDTLGMALWYATVHDEFYDLAGANRDVLFLSDGNYVAQVFPNRPDSFSYDYETLWTGGDLLAETGVPDPKGHIRTQGGNLGKI